MGLPLGITASQLICVGAQREAGVLSLVGYNVVNKGFRDRVAIAVGSGGEQAHQHGHIDVVLLNVRLFHLGSHKGNVLHLHLRYKLPSGLLGLGCLPV